MRLLIAIAVILGLILYGLIEASGWSLYTAFVAIVACLFGAVLALLLFGEEENPCA